MTYIGNLCVSSQLDGLEPEVEAEEISLSDIIPNKENQRLLRNIKIQEFALNIIDYKVSQ